MELWNHRPIPVLLTRLTLHSPWSRKGSDEKIIDNALAGSPPSWGVALYDKEQPDHPEHTEQPGFLPMAHQSSWKGQLGATTQP